MVLDESGQQLQVDDGAFPAGTRSTTWHGQQAVTSQNLDLLAAYERLERLGRPLNAVASVAPA